MYIEIFDKMLLILLTSYNTATYKCHARSQISINCYVIIVCKHVRFDVRIVSAC